MIRITRWHPESRSAALVTLESLPQAHGTLGEQDCHWIDLAAATPEEEQAILERFFPVHPLTLEDITKPRREPEEGAHLPKVEEFEGYLFVIVNPIPASFNETTRPAQPRSSRQPLRPQLSAVMTHNLLITHHYDSLKSVDRVWHYVQRHGHYTQRGPDYLFHLVLDEMVDEYAPVVEAIAERLDTLERGLFRRPVPAMLTRLLRMKREVSFLRKTLILEREVLAKLIRGQFALVNESEIVYYRNVYDHLVRYTELTESSREMVSDLMQSHLAAVSNRLNEVMKVLTMISTTVLPMTLVAGVYGMNFKHMPELEWEYGYALSLGLMGAALAASLALFRWKRWL